MDSGTVSDGIEADLTAASFRFLRCSMFGGPGFMRQPLHLCRKSTAVWNAMT